MTMTQSPTLPELPPQLSHLPAVQKDWVRAYALAAIAPYQTQLNECLEIRPIAKARLEKAEADARWIPVTERLPDDGVLVLTSLPNGNVWLGFRSGSSWAHLCEPDEDYDVTPTHWRPRPNAAIQAEGEKR